MSNKRVTFISLAYLIVALIMNSNGAEGGSYLLALVAVFIVSYFVYPDDDDKGKEDEKIYPGRDPRE